MASMEADSIDAIVTDPPYGLTFMGRDWDDLSKVPERGPGPRGRNPYAGWHGQDPAPASVMQEWHERWATAALRVAKPGAYLLAFGGTRTVHRLTVALEDAGWIIRDICCWVYASGFPKSKASLKPAWEPIVLARKPGPLRELAIDECRIGTEPMGGYEVQPGGYTSARRQRESGYRPKYQREDQPFHATEAAGRWPANVILTDPIFDGGWEGVVGGGEAGGGFGVRGAGPLDGRSSYALPGQGQVVGYGDTGTYSRFYRLPAIMSGCRYCGVPIAGSSSRANATSDTPSGIAPSGASSTPSEPSGTLAPTAASPSSRTGSSIALWSADDSPGQDAVPSSETSSTSAIEKSSSPLDTATTQSTPRSSAPEPSPDGTRPTAFAKSRDAGSPATGTTTTTDARWTCDTCADLITSSGTRTERENWPEPDEPLGDGLPPDAPRFYLVAKASRSDREPLTPGGLEVGPAGALNMRTDSHSVRNGMNTKARVNGHPTVKPVELMRHLVRLVTPTLSEFVADEAQVRAYAATLDDGDGTLSDATLLDLAWSRARERGLGTWRKRDPRPVVLDPFLGSGSTAIAAEQEGFDWIGIEREAEYVAIAEQRLVDQQRGLGLDVPAPTPVMPKTRPDYESHIPKRRSPSENWSGAWTGQEPVSEDIA
jgi:DNA modification methylase